MKKLVSLALAACLTACGSSKTTSAGSTPIQKTCSIGAKQNGIAEFRDPFETEGKVILRRSGELRSDDVGVLDEGTALAITLRNDCETPGQISREVLKQRRGPRPSGLRRTFTWRLPIAVTVGDLRTLADSDACVIGISESRVAKADALSSDPRVSEQRHLDMLEVARGSDLLETFSIGKPVVVAVIDTGLELEHPDIKDVLWSNPHEIPGNGKDDDDNGYVDDIHGYNMADDLASPRYSGKWSGYGHGTHVAGLAAARGGNAVGVQGVLGSGALIMAVNVFGREDGAATADMVNGIEYAADNGADVINVSIGGEGPSASLESALVYAVKKGAVVTLSAGNNGLELTSTYLRSPASYGRKIDGVMAVASLDSQTGTLSSFSNYGASYVEISAPGAETSSSGLLSTYPGGAYSRIRGTSMAAPTAAGAAATVFLMMRSRGYAPSAGTVEKIVRAGSLSKPELGAKIEAGRVLNLRSIAEFIDRTYAPVDEPVDPGIPDGALCP